MFSNIYLSIRRTVFLYTSSSWKCRAVQYAEYPLLQFLTTSLFITQTPKLLIPFEILPPSVLFFQSANFVFGIIFVSHLSNFVLPVTMTSFKRTKSPCSSPESFSRNVKQRLASQPASPSVIVSPSSPTPLICPQSSERDVDDAIDNTYSDEPHSPDDFQHTSPPPPLELLLDLPQDSPSAFSRVNPNTGNWPVRTYLPSHTDMRFNTCIRNERHNCLIRALVRSSVSSRRPGSASTSISSHRTLIVRGPTASFLTMLRYRQKLNAEKNRQEGESTVRSRLTNNTQPAMPEPTFSRVENCIRLAILFTCRRGGAPPNLHQLCSCRVSRLDQSLHQTLSSSVPSWSDTELTEYLTVVGITSFPFLTRPRMVQMVLKHLTYIVNRAS